MNASSLMRIFLNKVLSTKGKQCASFKEDARYQWSSVPEITVAAGGATTRTVQYLLWPEGMVLQSMQYYKQVAKPVWAPETGWALPLQAPPSSFEAASQSLTAALHWAMQLFLIKSASLGGSF